MLRAVLNISWKQHPEKLGLRLPTSHLSEYSSKKNYTCNAQSKNKRNLIFGCACIFYLGRAQIHQFCVVYWMILLLSHIHDTYTCRNKINNNDERTHFFRKIYPSHFIRNGCERVTKGLCVSGELETEQTATYWPLVPLSFAALLSRSAGLLSRRFWGVHSLLLGAGSLYSFLSLTNIIQLTELPVAPGYIIVWLPPASCERHVCTQFNPSTVKVIPWYLRPDSSVLLLTAGSKVNMLHFQEKRTIGIDCERVRESQRTSGSQHDSMVMFFYLTLFKKNDTSFFY